MPVPDWAYEAAKYGAGVLGGGAGLRFVDSWLGRRKTAADVRKIDAEAQQILGGLIDDRIRLLLDSMRSQIDWQATQIERLTKQVASQDEHIQRQEAEIIALRQELDRRPRVVV